MGAGLMYDTSVKLTKEQREEMVERFLRGEDAYTLGAAYGVHWSLPPLRAYTWGLVHNRAHSADVTDAGRAWLEMRTRH